MGTNRNYIGPDWLFLSCLVHEAHSDIHGTRKSLHVRVPTEFQILAKGTTKAIPKPNMRRDDSRAEVRVATLVVSFIQGRNYVSEKNLRCTERFDRKLGILFYVT